MEGLDEMGLIGGNSYPGAMIRTREEEFESNSGSKIWKFLRVMNKKDQGVDLKRKRNTIDTLPFKFKSLKRKCLSIMQIWFVLFCLLNYCVLI